MPSRTPMKILKEPLTHFVLAAALLFGLYALVDPRARELGDDEILVSAGRIEQLSGVFRKTWQRPPTREELEGLIDDFILEEIYYREATAAGLDHDDTLIRRRLRQKMEFLTEDLAAGLPSEAELRTFVDENPDRFREPATYTFRQIFFDPERLGDEVDTVLAEAARELESGEEPEGHSTLLPPSVREADPRRIAMTFGESFRDALVSAEVGTWHGPVRSAFGLHFITIDEKRDGRLPPFEEIEREAQREWEHAQRSVFREKFERELRERYAITVDWPRAAGAGAETSQADGPLRGVPVAGGPDAEAEGLRE